MMSDNTLIESIKGLEPGCRKLNNQLANPLKNIYLRFNTGKLIYGRLINILMSKNGRFFSDMVHSTNLIKPGHDSSHLSDNAEFLDAIERLGIPEARVFVQNMRQQRIDIRNSASKRLARKSSETTIQNQAEKAGSSGEKDILASHFVVYKKILDDESLFSIKARNEYLLKINEIEMLFEIIENFRVRADCLNVRVRPIFDLGESLEKIIEMYNNWRNSLDKLAEAEKAYSLIANEEIPEKDNNPSISDQKLNESRPLYQRSNALESSLNKTRKTLSDHETVLKAHFANNSNLIKPIAAVLNNIQFLCSNLVKIEIRDISVWEIDMAKKQWKTIYEKIPRNHPLSTFDPSTIIKAMEYLEENEDFLNAFNSAKHAREEITKLEHEISDITDQKTNEPTPPPFDIQTLKTEQERRRAKLSNAIKDLHDKADEIGMSIYDSLEPIRKNAKINKTLDSIKPPDFWSQIEESICGNILNDVGRSLDVLDKEMQTIIDTENQKA